MNQTIDAIANLPGVNCVVVFDPATNIAAQHLEVPLEEDVLREIVTKVSSVLDTCSAMSLEGPGGLFQMFQEGYLAVRRTNHHVLMAITSKQANLAMLRIAMNMSVRKLEQIKVTTPPPIPSIPIESVEVNLDTDSQLEIDASSVTDTSQSVTSTSTSTSSETSRSRSTGTSLSMSMSWREESKRTSKRYLTEDAIGIKVMQHVLVKLARLIGKHDATFFLEEELHKIGETPNSIKHDQFGELIKCVARRISDSDKRETFIIQALGDRPTT